MSFTLQAIILKDSLSLESELTDCAVQLPQELTLLPLTEKMLTRFNIPWLPFTDEGMTELPEGLNNLGSSLSAEGHIVVYVEAEMFGGAGVQSMVAWSNGKVTHGPICSQSAINEALQLLGVKKEVATDEFDALKLGRYRDTEDWTRV